MSNQDWSPFRVRDAAAADLLERLAATLRKSGADALNIGTVTACVDAIVHYDTPEVDYRRGLDLLGARVDDINAAVAAILDGKLPPDSLAGKVAEHHRDASKRRDVAKESGEAYALGHAGGCSGTARYVLDLLGVKVTP